MSLTDHPDERERLHRCIAECQDVIDTCPQSDNGWSGATCRTCIKQREYIAEYRDVLAALDADDAERSTTV